MTKVNLIIVDKFNFFIGLEFFVVKYLELFIRTLLEMTGICNKPRYATALVGVYPKFDR